MFRRMAVTPFEIAIAILLIIYGVANFLNTNLFDPLRALLPGWESWTVGSMGVLSGLLIVMGIARSWRGGEAAGLIFLWAVIMTRFVSYGYYLGFGSEFLVQGIFDTAVIVATIVRLNTIRKGSTIVLLVEGRSRIDTSGSTDVAGER